VWIVVVTEFSLYLDDGGHPDDQPALVVAGYIATENQWLAFEPEWNAALSRFNLGKSFHMTDFMGARYSSLKRDQILSTLALIVNKHVSRPFVAAVDMAAYKKVNKEFALQEWLGAPYALIARLIARDFRDWEKNHLGKEDRLLVFVEQGTKHYGDLEQVFKRDDIPMPSRVPKYMPQVQPADILAWETFNQIRSGKVKSFGKNLQRLTRAMRKQGEFGGIFYEGDLRHTCVDSGAPKRGSVGANDTIAFHSERKRKRKRTIF
jgi:hypothetical protein